MIDGKPELSDRKIISKIAWKKGNENQAPCYVYVRAISANYSYDDKPCYICEKLNTGETHFANKEDLTFEIDYFKQDIELCHWKSNDLKKASERFEKMAEEKELSGK